MQDITLDFPIVYNGNDYTVNAIQNYTDILYSNFEIISVINSATSIKAFESLRFGNISMAKPPRSHFVYHLFMNKPVELVRAIEDGLAKYMRRSVSKK